MDYHPVYGPSVPEKGWVPAPRYLLRRQRILRLLNDIKPGNLLEVGCGAGTLCHELSNLGYMCTALETSQHALNIARHVNKDSPGVNIHDSPSSRWKNSYDLLMSNEVLEHILLARKTD